MILPLLAWIAATLLIVFRCYGSPQFDFMPTFVAAQMVRRGEVAVLYDHDPEHTNRAGPRFRAAAKELGIDEPSTPYIYPPFYAVLMQPATWMSYPTARALMLVANLVCLLLASALLSRIVFSGAPSLAYRLVAPLVAAAAAPVHHAVWLGQNSLFLLLLLALALQLLNERREVLSGVAMGMCSAVKLTPGAFLLIMGAARQKKATLAGVATVAVIHLLALPWTGTGALSDYLKVIGRLGPQNGVAAANNQSFHAWLLRLRAPVEDLLHWRRLHVPFWTRLVWGLWAAAVGVSVWLGLVRPRPRTKCKQENLVLFSAAALLSCLAPHLVWDHHLLLLAFPLLLTLSSSNGEEHAVRRRLWWILALALLAANTWGVPLTLYSPGEVQQVAGLRGLAVSANLYGGIILLVLSWRVVSRRRQPAACA